MGEVLGHQIPGAAAVTALWERALSERMQLMGLGLGGDVAGRLARYHALLADWNERLNLVGNADFDDALDRHYMDSLAPLAIEGLFTQGARVIDVGSGAGFPGLALAIARPDMRVTLLDSLGKRVTFLNAVIEALGLSNAHTLHARAEDAAHRPGEREGYDVAVARAVAPLNVLMELLLPFVNVGGRAACYKGPAAQGELPAAARAAATLGGGAPAFIPVPIPTQPDWGHGVVLVPKVKKTVRLYPRKAGTPGRNPLGEPDRV